tara:strand:+ start:211 stop:597 length:387 start_codon:yes stop_codon:yes gene_type:complete
MTKRLTIGDLVWYNVGGRGYETMGLVVEAADLWRPSQPWEASAPKKYANSVRIKWLRTGLKPKPIHMPVYRHMIKMTYEDMCSLGRKHSGFAAWERDSILSSMGEVETGEWYEGRFFKKLGAADKRRK